MSDAGPPTTGYPGPVTESATPARPGRQPAVAARAQAPSGSPTGARPLSRIKNRRKAGPLYKAAMVVFTVGLVAICVDAGMFVAGSRDIPWWLHLVTLLAPIGLGIGLIGTVAEARREGRPPGQ